MHGQRTAHFDGHPGEIKLSRYVRARHLLDTQAARSMPNLASLMVEPDGKDRTPTSVTSQIELFDQAGNVVGLICLSLGKTVPGTRQKLAKWEIDLCRHPQRQDV